MCERPYKVKPSRPVDQAFHCRVAIPKRQVETATYCIHSCSSLVQGKANGHCYTLSKPVTGYRSCTSVCFDYCSGDGQS